MTSLTAEIVTDHFKPGDKLPRETDLSERFGVSRGVVRECLRAMEERGLISVRHGSGAVVNDSDRWDTLNPDVLSAMLDSPRSVEVLKSYIECRRILEVEAAGLAAQRATKEHIEKMTVALQRMEECIQLQSDSAAEELFHEADIAFHQAMIHATRNYALASLTESIHSALLQARYPLARPQFRAERSLPEHRRILVAVAAGDPEEARAAMSAHLETVGDYLEDHATKKGAKRSR